MKVYLHHCDFTKRIAVDECVHKTVQDLLADFVIAYESKHTVTVDHLTCSAQDDDGKDIALTTRVTALDDLCDLYINFKIQHDSAATKQEAESGVHHQGDRIDSAGLACVQTSNTQQVVAKQLLQHLVAKAEAAVASGNYAGAGEMYKQLLAVVSDAPDLLYKAAHMWLKKAGQAKKAEPYARKLSKLLPTSSFAQQLLADCLLEQGEQIEAIKAYDAALVLVLDDTPDQLLETVLSVAASASGSGTSATTDQGASSSSARRTLDLQTALASALFSVKDDAAMQDAAAKLVMDVLGKDEGHWEALKLYAHIAERQGLHEDCLRVALRLIVAPGKSKDMEVQHLLGRRLAAEGGLEVLFDELSVPSTPTPPTVYTIQCRDNQSADNTSGNLEGSNHEQSNRVPTDSSATAGSGSAAALAFLAMAVRDVSAVDATIALLEKALALDPLHAAYTLNLAHVWELHQRLDMSIITAAAFFSRVVCCGDDDSKKSELSVGGRLDAQAVLSVLSGVPPGQTSAVGTVWRDNCGWGSTISNQHVPPATSSNHGQVAYTSSQLDVLALCFTAIKVLFVGGHLTAAHRLSELVSPAREASQVALHTTLIRNEAAYYGCVQQLLQDYPPPPLSGHSQTAHQQLGPGPQPLHLQDTNSVKPSSNDQDRTDNTSRSGVLSGAGGDDGGTFSATCTTTLRGHPSEKPMYVVGDSHCLSLAWRTVTIRHQKRTLHPVLVTGCKVWHLRPASHFYPKVQFAASVASVPVGSQVMMVLGEIDCREGLLLAVAKGKYDSLDDAVRAAVSMYMSVLKTLATDKGLELFIHPVPPVLNETRNTVLMFNKELKAQCDKLSEDEALQGRIHFLDFHNQLLTADGSALLTQYQLDGTHLAPTYVNLIQEQLDTVH